MLIPKKGPNLTLKTIRLFEKFGWITENFNQFGIINLFDFADCITFHPEGGCVMVLKITDRNKMSAQTKKIYQNNISKQWLKSAARRIIIVGWLQNEEHKKWEVTMRELQLDGKTTEFSEQQLNWQPV